MANPIHATVQYLRSSVAELKKVTWPTKEMTMRYSAIVIIVSIAVAAFFAGLDYAFSHLVTSTIGRNAPVAPAQDTTIPNIETIPEVENASGLQIETQDGQIIETTPEANTVQSESSPE